MQVHEALRASRRDKVRFASDTCVDAGGVAEGGTASTQLVDRLIRGEKEETGAPSAVPIDTHNLHPPPPMCVSVC